MKVLSRLLALGLAGIAIAACSPPVRDTLYRGPAYYTPTDQRVMLDIVARQSGELAPR